MVTPTLILKVEENEQTSSAISHAHAPSSENAAAAAAAAAATTSTVAAAQAAAAPETAVMDKYLATGDEFFQRLCLVTIKSKRRRVGPRLLHQHRVYST